MTNSAFPLPQSNLEQGLIYAAIANEENWNELRQQFNSDDFSAQKAVFQFVEQFLAQYGNLPTSSILSTRFDWQPPLGDFKYWVNEMKRYVMARKITEVMQEAFKAVGNPDQAFNILVDRLAEIRSKGNTHIQAYDSSARERYDKYLMRNKYLFNSNTILGIPTNMRIIDETKMGWTPGNLVGVFSRPGVGKSWWLVWQAAMAWANGYKTVVLSNEMPANQLSLRVDILIANLMGTPIEYTKLIHGDPEVKNIYDIVTQALEQSQRMWIYDSVNEQPANLSDISSLIRLHQPSLLCIDGISLLRATHTQVWEQMKELSYGLKNLSIIHNVPILITHQAVNSAKGRRTEVQTPGRGDDFIMPSLNDIAYGDSFGQACSDVISLCGDPKFRHILWYSLRKTRERAWQQAMPQRMAFAWDPGFGRIIDLSERGYNPAAIGEEARRVLGLTELK